MQTTSEIQIDAEMARQKRGAASFFWMWLIVATAMSVTGNVAHAVLHAQSGAVAVAAGAALVVGVRRYQNDPNSFASRRRPWTCPSRGGTRRALSERVLRREASEMAPDAFRLLAAVASVVPSAFVLGSTHSIALSLRMRRFALIHVSGLLMTIAVAACASFLSGRTADEAR
jgi:hypothetical protein